MAQDERDTPSLGYVQLPDGTKLPVLLGDRGADNRQPLTDPASQASLLFGSGGGHTVTAPLGTYQGNTVSAPLQTQWGWGEAKQQYGGVGGSGGNSGGPGQYYPLMAQVPDAKPLLTTFGATGTAIPSGIITSEEYNPDFFWRDAIALYEQMSRSEGQASAITYLLELPIRRATVSIEPFSDDPQDKEVASFIESCLFHDLKRQTLTGRTVHQAWDDVLRHVLMMLRFGFSAFEVNWRVEDGWVKWSHFLPLLPRTVWRWWVGEDSELEGIQQWTWKGYTYRYVDIPADKLLLFVHRQEGQNYEGVSLFRAAYQHWYYKQQFYRIQAVGIERNAISVPVIYLPPSFTPQDVTNAQTILQNLRANEQMGVTLPPGWKLEYTRNWEHTDSAVQPAIDHHDVMMARSVLAQFVNLGSTETGAYALDSSQKATLMAALQAECEYIEDIFNNDAIPRLVDYNFAEVPGYPKLKFSKVLAQDFDGIAGALQKLVNMPTPLIHPDLELEDFLRNELGIPKAPKSVVEGYNPSSDTNASTPTQDGGDGGAGDQEDESGTQANTATTGSSKSLPEEDDGGDQGGGALAELREEARLLTEALGEARRMDAVERGLIFGGGGFTSASFDPAQHPHGADGRWEVTTGGAKAPGEGEDFTKAAFKGKAKGGAGKGDGAKGGGKAASPKAEEPAKPPKFTSEKSAWNIVKVHTPEHPTMASATIKKSYSGKYNVYVTNKDGTEQKYYSMKAAAINTLLGGEKPGEAFKPGLFNGEKLAGEQYVPGAKFKAGEKDPNTGTVKVEISGHPTLAYAQVDKEPYSGAPKYSVVGVKHDGTVGLNLIHQTLANVNAALGAKGTAAIKATSFVAAKVKLTAKQIAAKAAQVAKDLAHLESENSKKLAAAATAHAALVAEAGKALDEAIAKTYASQHPIDHHWEGKSSAGNWSDKFKGATVTVEAIGGSASMTVSLANGTSVEKYIIAPDFQHGGYKMTNVANPLGGSKFGLTYAELSNEMKSASGWPKANAGYSGTTPKSGGGSGGHAAIGGVAEPGSGGGGKTPGSPGYKPASSKSANGGPKATGASKTATGMLPKEALYKAPAIGKAQKALNEEEQQQKDAQALWDSAIKGTYATKSHAAYAVDGHTTQYMHPNGGMVSVHLGDDDKTWTVSTHQPLVNQLSSPQAHYYDSVMYKGSHSQAPWQPEPEGSKNYVTVSGLKQGLKDAGVTNHFDETTFAKHSGGQWSSPNTYSSTSSSYGHSGPATYSITSTPTFPGISPHSTTGQKLAYQANLANGHSIAEAKPVDSVGVYKLEHGGGTVEVRGFAPTGKSTAAQIGLTYTSHSGKQEVFKGDAEEAKASLAAHNLDTQSHLFVDMAKFDAERYGGSLAKQSAEVQARVAATTARKAELDAKYGKYTQAGAASLIKGVYKEYPEIRAALSAHLNGGHHLSPENIESQMHGYNLDAATKAKVGAMSHDERIARAKTGLAKMTEITEYALLHNGRTTREGTIRLFHGTNGNSSPEKWEERLNSSDERRGTPFTDKWSIARQFADSSHNNGQLIVAAHVPVSAVSAWHTIRGDQSYQGENEYTVTTGAAPDHSIINLKAKPN